MKKYYSLLFALLAVMAMALVVVSCNKETDYEEPKPESKNQITFTTEHPVGSKIWLFLKRGEQPTEVIGAKEIYDENPFDGDTNPFDGSSDNGEIILGLELEKQTVTIKGDITYITFYEPMLTALDVSNNPILEYLSLHYNKSHLASLDVSKNIALTTLICDGSQLEELDVSKNTALQVLSCNENNLTSLDVSKNTELYAFSCAYNQLTTLDVSKNKALKFLGCDGNDFSSIDVSNNTKLERLSCSSNNLSSLDVSKNTELGSLDCYNNKLTSLDISKNPKLKKLHCYCNQIKTEEMSKLVDALPSWPPQTDVLQVYIYPVKPSSPDEQNEITEEAIKIAEDKNWSMIIY